MRSSNTFPVDLELGGGDFWRRKHCGIKHATKLPLPTGMTTVWFGLELGVVGYQMARHELSSSQTDFCFRAKSVLDDV